MKIIKTALVLSILFLITGCSIADSNNEASNEISSEGSYQAVLLVNGEVLHTAFETADELDFVTGEFVGTIKGKFK